MRGSEGYDGLLGEGCAFCQVDDVPGVHLVYFDALRQSREEREGAVEDHLRVLAEFGGGLGVLQVRGRLVVNNQRSNAGEVQEVDEPVDLDTGEMDTGDARKGLLIPSFLLPLAH